MRRNGKEFKEVRGRDKNIIFCITNYLHHIIYKYVIIYMYVSIKGRDRNIVCTCMKTP